MRKNISLAEVENPVETMALHKPEWVWCWHNWVIWQWCWVRFGEYFVRRNVRLL